MVDFLVLEALSVLCRRAAERKTTPLDLDAALAVMRGWFNAGEVRFLAREADRLAGDILNVVSATRGALNSNDALIVALMREGTIEILASFDERFDALDDFQRTS
ncbi:MAG TPA: PIN domain-containing protein [Polyangiaceae bacterium]